MAVCEVLSSSRAWVFMHPVVDNATAYKGYFVIKSLKEIGTIVKTFIKQLKKQPRYIVKRIMTDGGIEFVNNILNNHRIRNELVY
ncbi:MSP domain containing hypothetical protein [Phytophthora palmivora]|uniref:Uncharacterized protein n=1 Tax=Phytophthora palmivora TaxID=4796 RepID=A0A2P4XWC0_9STRA|nr:MSP domain containing hypothetical protein [Phytophthora palmivora]